MRSVALAAVIVGVGSIQGGCDEPPSPPARDAGVDALDAASPADARPRDATAGLDAGDSGTAAGDDAGPEAHARRLTPPGSSWWDPEVLATDTGAWITWQAQSGDVWLASLDGGTGEISSGTERRLAGDGAELRRTFNGPEFGVDASGFAVYYTSARPGGELQAARARLSGGAVQIDLLTSGDTHFSPLPSRDPSAGSTRLILLRRPPDWGSAHWVDLAAPSVSHDLFVIENRPDFDARWVVGTRAIVTDGLPTSSGREEVSILDTETGVSEQVSGGEGQFGNAYGWLAPETAGGLQVLALTDDRVLTIWRREESGWTRVMRRGSPVETLPYLGSPEPFVVGDRSYVSVVASEEADPRPGITEQQVWLFALDSEAPAGWRCDDGEPGRTRADPEVLVVGDRVFVYYYSITQSRSEVWVCATSVPTP